MLTDSCNFNEGPAVVQLAVDGVAGYTTYQLQFGVPPATRNGNMHSIYASEAAPLVLPAAFQADASLGEFSSSLPSPRSVGW
jgi:hypothetical protein